jgi:hypothetical protein
LSRLDQVSAANVKSSSDPWWSVPPMKDAFWSNWALVFIGLWAAKIAVKTLKKIKEQTEAALIAAKAARDTVEIMKDTAQKELRAYVFLSSASRIKKKEDGKLWLKVVFKNFGQTPAYACSHWASEAVPSNPQRLDVFPRPPRGMPQSVYTLPPGSQIEIWEPGTEIKPLSEGDIRSGLNALYLYGEIRYKDAFGNDQTAKFRFMCTGEAYDEGRFIACESGNEAT